MDPFTAKRTRTLFELLLRAFLENEITLFETCENYFHSARLRSTEDTPQAYKRWTHFSGTGVFAGLKLSALSFAEKAAFNASKLADASSKLTTCRTAAFQRNYAVAGYPLAVKLAVQLDNELAVRVQQFANFTIFPQLSGLLKCILAFCDLKNCEIPTKFPQKLINENTDEKYVKREKQYTILQTSLKC